MGVCDRGNRPEDSRGETEQACIQSVVGVVSNVDEINLPDLCNDKDVLGWVCGDICEIERGLRDTPLLGLLATCN